MTQQPLETDWLSLADWGALPEETPGEWFDGCLTHEEVPDFVHELLVALLVRVLGNWIFPQGGLVAGSEAKFAVSSERGRKPDVTVYLPGSPRPPARGVIDVPPDIAIEVVSTTPRDGRRDRVEKMEDYATFGVRFYWILDPQLRSLEVFELAADGRYVRALGATQGTLEQVPGCEGLCLDLDALWAEVDRLEGEGGGP